MIKNFKQIHALLLSNNKIFQKISYLLITIIIIILPYYGLFEYFRHLSIALLILTIASMKIDIKELLKNKVFISLSIFIFFTYLSILWTSSTPTITMETHTNFNRFKYYLILIISIYFSSLNIKQIKSLFLLMAIAPLGTVIVYYLNSMDITHIYSAIFFNGNTNLLSHYLINNFFILYSAIYFYILFFEYLTKRNYKLSLLYGLISIIFIISMFIDSLSTSRLIILVFFIMALIIPLFYLRHKSVLIILLITLILSSIYMNKSEKMQKGVETFKIAINEDRYTASWGHRLGFAIVGFKIFKENMIIGRGISDVKERTIQFANDNPKYFIEDPNRHFHNEHINLLVQVGLIGYSLFLIFIFLFMRTTIDDSFLNKLKYAFIISFFLLMLGEHYLTMRQPSTFFSLFIALILLYHKKEKQELKIINGNKYE